MMLPLNWLNPCTIRKNLSRQVDDCAGSDAEDERQHEGNVDMEDVGEKVFIEETTTDSHFYN